MDVSEVRARPDGKGVAQTDWSGCAPLEANLTLADGHKLIDLLPNRRSDDQYLWSDLAKLRPASNATCGRTTSAPRERIRSRRSISISKISTASENP